jgi:hypothetical protein
MRRWLWRHPFLAFGLCTLLLFFAVEALRAEGATEAARRLTVPLRRLIIPMYLVWLVFTMLYVATWGPGAQLHPLGLILSGFQFIAGLAPYVAADHLLQRWRTARTRSRRAA